MKTRVAVTGAGGFLGRHVLAALGARPDIETVAVSRRLPPTAWPAGVRSVAYDLSVEEIGETTYDQLERPDIVIHLAWEGVRDCRSLHHLANELPRQYRFLDALVRTGLGRLTVAGTCLEYGLRDGELTEDLLVEPITPYGLAKRTLCRQLQFLQKQIPFGLSWARLFYMYGEGQAAGSLYPLFQTALARGDASFPMSGGEQLRDYLPAVEVARLLVTLALDVPGQGVVNVCSGRPLAVRSLVEGWRKEAGADIVLELGRYPYTDYEPMAFWGATGRLQAVLNA